MSWKIKHRSECYPGLEAQAKSRERLVRLLLIAVIVILSLLSWIFASRVMASTTYPTGLDWIQKAGGHASTLR